MSTSSSSSAPAAFSAAGTAPVLHVLGAEIRWRVSSAVSNGSYTCFEAVAPAGTGVPPHSHADCDECLLVLEGELEFMLDGQRLRAGAGDVMHMPRGVPHAWQNVGSAAARLYCVAVPASLEALFQELATAVRSEADFARVPAIAAAHGVTMYPA